MVVNVEINSQSRWPHEADPQLITQQINRRRADGQMVTVRVTVEDASIHLTLMTPGCVSRGGRVHLTSDEQAVADIWERRGLMHSDITAGHVIAFLQQLSHS